MRIKVMPAQLSELKAEKSVWAPESQLFVHPMGVEVTGDEKPLAMPRDVGEADVK